MRDGDVLNSSDVAAIPATYADEAVNHYIKRMVFEAAMYAGDNDTARQKATQGKSTTYSHRSLPSLTAGLPAGAVSCGYSSCNSVAAVKSGWRRIVAIGEGVWARRRVSGQNAWVRLCSGVNTVNGATEKIPNQSPTSSLSPSVVPTVYPEALSAHTEIDRAASITLRVRQRCSRCRIEPC